MAPATEIYNLLNNAATKQLNYCLFCLRSEMERRLVKPETFLKCFAFYKPARLCWPLSMDTNSICYICDRELQRAMRMFHAMDFALAVQRCLNEVQDTVWDFNHFCNTINKNVEMREGLTLSDLWREVRALGDLTRTEVLQVTSDPPTVSQQTQTLMDPDAVVVIEDEDLPEEVDILPRLVDVQRFLRGGDHRLAAVVYNKMILMARPHEQTDRILIHKMEARNGTIYVPSLKAKIQYNALVHSDCEGLLAEEPRVYIPKGVQVEMNAEKGKLQTILESRGSEKRVCQRSSQPEKQSSYVSKLSDVISAGTVPVKKTITRVAKQREQISVSDVVANTMRAKASTQDTTPGKDVNQIYDPGKGSDPNRGVLNESTPSNGSQKPRFSFETDDDDPLRPDARKKEEEITKGLVLATQAIMSGRVDWEDKIPMDVISFMDATDPNAGRMLPKLTPRQQLPRPSSPVQVCMPTIQNVEGNHLEENQQVYNKRRRKDSAQCIVIDLC